VRPAVYPGRGERASYGVVVKVKPEPGTGPLDTGGLKVTFTVCTSSPGISNTPLPSVSWKSWIVPDVNATSVMFSVRSGFGQPGAPRIGVSGAPVTVVIVRFRFLMSNLVPAVDPVRVTGATFRPGGWVAPAGFVHAAVAFPVAVTICRVSKFPRPA